MSLATLEREFQLPPMGELRIITLASGKCATRVLVRSVDTIDANDQGDETGNSPEPTDDAGRAEVFGSVITRGAWTTLPAGQSIPIFTPTGCLITVSGPPKVFQQVYATTLGATAVRSAVDLHRYLELNRKQAYDQGADGVGPRVLIIGDRRGIGKSSLALTLANYAVRLGYHPLLLDVDVRCPRFGYPECLSLYNLQYPVDVEEHTTSVPGQHVVFGSQSKHENPALFMHTVRQMMNTATHRMARNERCRIGGMFVDYGVIEREYVEDAEESESAAGVDYGMLTSTGASAPTNSLLPLPGSSGNFLQPPPAAHVSQHSTSRSTKPNPLDLLLDTVMEVEADNIFVMQSNWLRFKLIQRALERYGDPTAREVIAYNASPVGAPLPSVITLRNGISLRVTQVDGNPAATALPDAFLNRQKWLQYFFGTVTSPVKPNLVTVSRAALQLIQVGTSTADSMSTLVPMVDEDAPVKEDPAMLTYLRPEDINLLHRIIAISPVMVKETLADGTTHDIPFRQREQRLKECVTIGFSLVHAVHNERVTLLIPGAQLAEERGICAYPLTSEVESSSSKR